MPKGQELDWDADTHRPEFESLLPAILEAAPGTRFGPVHGMGEHLVFVKSRNVGFRLRSREEVAPVIREQLQREKLEQRELALAAELVAKFVVEDGIDYHRFGLDATQVSLPWR